MGDDPLELTGDVIDGMYRVDSFVGFGDLSVVYRGFHVGVEADIAIKLLDLPTTLDVALVAPLVRSFREGSRIHYRLARSHLHIAHSISSGQTLAPRTGAMMPYLVREWLDGFSLAHDFSDRSARKLGGRSLGEAIELFRGAIDGLAYAHRQGVAHLALNPTNFFLARSGAGEVKLKILDFGVANAINTHAWPVRAHARKGSSSASATPGLRVLLPAYAAPEQLDSAVGESGPATDVYTMALVIAEALAGKPMFGEAPPPLDQTLRPEARPIRLPPSLDPRVALVLKRALSFSPRARHEHAGIFCRDFLEASGENPTSIPPGASMPPSRGSMPIIRRTSAPDIPAMRRSQTLLGLSAQVSKPAPANPAPTKQAPARQTPSKPPPPIAKPSRPPPRAPDDAPTHVGQDVITAPGGDPITIQAPMPNMPAPRYEETLPFAGAPQVPSFFATPPPPLAIPPSAPPMMAAAPPIAPPFAPYFPAVEPPATTSQSLKTVRPPMMLRTSRTIVGVVVGLALAILVLAGIALSLGRSDSRTARTADTIPTASAAPVASMTPMTSATTSVAAVIPPTIATARTVDPPPEISPTATTTAPAPAVRRVASRHHFTIAEGRDALDAASSTLGDCKRPHGHFGSGSIRATFSPWSGNVIHVQLGPPYVGSEQGRCIIAKFMTAQVRPFHGPPSAINYIFRFPR